MISPEKFSWLQIVVNGKVFLRSGKIPMSPTSSGTVNRSSSVSFVFCLVVISRNCSESIFSPLTRLS